MLDTPAFLDRAYLGNPVAAWLIALAVLVGGWLALVGARRLLIRRLERFAARTTTAADDVALEALRLTSAIFLFVVALTTAVHVALALPPNVTRGVALLAKLAFLMQAARWGSGAITLWLAHVGRRRGSQDAASITTLNVIGVIARLVLWTLIALLALAAFGVDVTALVTGLGIAGVAVALAVQNVLGDLLASLSIALDKPFVIGDTINVDGIVGTVDNIGLKTTRLRALSGELLVFSNADLLKSRIRNYRGTWDRRVLFTIGLTFDTTADQAALVPAIIREIVSAEPQTRFDRSHFAGFGDSSLTFESVYFVLGSDYNTYMDIHQRVLLALMRRLQAEGIAFAFPTRTVVIQSAAQDELRRARLGGADEGPAPAPTAPTPPR